MLNLKKWITVFIFFFTLSLCAHAATTPEKSKFPSTINLGGIEWTLGNSQEDDNLELAEYVTKGENVNNWTQLLTIQKFKFPIKEEITPKKFAEFEITQLQGHKEFKIVTNIIDANKSQAFMEFQVQSPKAEQQHELQRIIKTPDNKLIIIHYVIKKDDMGNKEKTKWLDALKNYSNSP